MAEKKFEKISEKLSLAVSDEHSFGTDAFLLASFSAPRRKDMVCDLGTGCGIIPFLMKKGFSPKIIYAVDIQENAINLLKESISVDTSLITEISEGKDGIRIKLVDKTKALEFLSKHLNLLSDEETDISQQDKKHFLK